MIYNTLYTLIEAKINAIAGIKSFDWYNQQYFNLESERAEPYPAVYFELQNPLVWKEAGNKMQNAEANITLHICVNTLEDKPNKLFAIVDLVEKAINGKIIFDASGNQVTTELVRGTTDFVLRQKNLKVFKTAFKTEIFDINLMPATTPGVINDFVIT